MKSCIHIILAGGLAALSTTSSALALDQVRTHSKETIRGQITEISPTEVKIDKSPVVETIPINDVIAISFDREPGELSRARNLATSGQYADALEVLKTVDRAEITNEQNKELVLQDMDYYTAYCTTQLALGGAGTIKSAGDLMQAFFKNNKKSYHYLESAELMGDLLVAFGKEASHSADKARQAAAPQMFNNAMIYYDEAGKAPWQGADVSLNLKRGRALLAQKKPTEAVQAFQSVLDGASGPQAESLKLSAVLGKALALAEGKKSEEAIKLVDDVIQKAPKSNTEVQAQAYLTLGHCHRAANKPKEAVMDYLHVDLLYFQNPQVHAEALASLAQVWQSLNRPDRANEFNARLSRMYPNSIWAK